MAEAATWVGPLKPTIPAKTVVATRNMPPADVAMRYPCGPRWCEAPGGGDVPY